MVNLSLSNSNISYAVFGSLPPSGSGSSVYSDNFSFVEKNTAAPEPSSFALLGLGLAGLGLRLRKRQS
jgi:hypothetical protein